MPATHQPQVLAKSDGGWGWEAARVPQVSELLRTEGAWAPCWERISAVC